MTSDDMLGIILGYEVYCAISKRWPLITTLCRRHRLLVLPILAATALHLTTRKESIL